VDNKLIGVPQNFQTTESRGLMIEDVIMICWLAGCLHPITYVFIC
jgi:hypothetical protein